MVELELAVVELEVALVELEVVGVRTAARTLAPSDLPGTSAEANPARAAVSAAAAAIVQRLTSAMRSSALSLA